MIGTIIIFIKNINHNRIIAYSLSFASGVMLTISLTDLIPESIKLINTNNYFITIFISLIFVFIGIYISLFLDKITTKNNNNLLYKTGILSMIAIIIHNIPEGIITFITADNNIKLGINLTIAIALHNIPEGISIAVPIYYSTNSKIKAIKYTLISALSEPLGALLTFIFLKKFINSFILGILFSCIAGFMLEISIFNLLPTSKKYQYDNLKNIFFIIGIITMLIKFIL